MRKLVGLLTFLLLLIVLLPSQGMAQQRSISGTVRAENQGPLEGVSVAVKSSNRITQTDASGHFSIQAATGEVLVLTYVGYELQEVKVNSSSVFNITMKVLGNNMNEVVVTALGIKKERKALGYSVTDLNAQELMKNKNTNVVNSLAGKIPGVNVTQFSGAPGAGASITIRGATSTSETRQNQPLFVVDGIIYDNSTTVTGNTGTDGLSRSNTTYSNRVMDINPEDIETLSVLKGAAAAALYGARAADGVIVITTKKGAEGRVTVNFTSKISNSWADKLPEAQNVFGAGSVSSNGVVNTDSYLSWGPKIPADSTIYNNIGNFFQHGLIYDNNVNVSGGSKNGSFYLSGSNFKQTGIVPGTGYNKTTFRFNGEQKYGRLTLNATTAYSFANTDRTLTSAGLYGSGVGSMQELYSWPQTYDIRNYINPDGSQHRIYAATITDLANDVDNPFWIINQDKLTSKTNRFTGGINGNFKITDWWDITGRLGYDQYSTNDNTFIAPGSAVIAKYQNGRLSKDQVNYTYVTTTVMTNFHKSIKDFDTHVLLGTTSDDFNTNVQNLWGWNFSTPGTVSLNSIDLLNKQFSDNTIRRRLVGVYGEVGVSYKDIVYLTATGRNDWSSTLPVENQSYFYPSLSGSFVFTQLLPHNNILSFGKLRASWARVGKDANAYATNTYENPPVTILAGNGSYVGIGNQWQGGNASLIPEIQTSWEIGGEFRLLNGRIGLDYTYYHSQTANQIGSPRLAQSGGFIFSTLNAGTVINKGMEIALTGKVISQKDFDWDATLNFSYNRGTLGAFIPGVQYFYPTDVQFGTIKAASIPNGGPFLGIIGQPYLRELDKNGKEIPNGRYQIDPTTGFYKLNPNLPIVGNREPRYIGGFNNSFRYKNLSLNLLLDVRIGGDVFNGTEYFMVVNGLSKKTLLNDRQSVTLNGVSSTTGADTTITYNAGQSYTIGTTTYAGANRIYQYWQNYAANSSNFITSVNWLKLRSLSFTYDFTSMFKKQGVIKGLSATAVGTNLFTWTNYKGMDPEVSVAGGTGGSGSTGIDYLGVPSVSSFTFGINLKF
jgi:TonB-linked SusC/RagA family outer membrane protein